MGRGVRYRGSSILARRGCTMTAGEVCNRHVGIVTDRDIALAIDRLRRLPHLTVADVMSGDLVTSSERESVYDVLKKMQSHGIRRLPVVNERGGLEGILAFDDVIELLSEEMTDLAKLVAKEQKYELDVSTKG